jgi:hypothetical protein
LIFKNELVLMELIAFYDIKFLFDTTGRQQEAAGGFGE